MAAKLCMHLSMNDMGAKSISRLTRICCIFLLQVGLDHALMNGVVTDQQSLSHWCTYCHLATILSGDHPHKTRIYLSCTLSLASLTDPKAELPGHSFSVFHPEVLSLN